MEKLKLKQLLTVFLFYIIGVVYILTDQLYVPKEIRLIVLLLVFTSIFIALFVILKTSRPIALSNTLALLLLIIVLPMYFIKDLAIDHNFTIKPIIVVVSSLIFPYIVGIIAAIVRKVSQISSSNSE